MIVAFPGAAFTQASDGDQRGNHAARLEVSRRLGIGTEWATVRQVHGSRVVRVDQPGMHGDADGMVTRIPALPLAVFTADCLGVVIRGRGGLAVAHAGWRGLSAGILEETVEALRRLGVEAEEAVVGPAIGPCCYEVGDDVASRFPGFEARTRWGTRSVDLIAAARARIGLPVRKVGSCTMCGPDAHSFRSDRTTHRMAAIGWIPEERR